MFGGQIDDILEKGRSWPSEGNRWLKDLRHLVGARDVGSTLGAATKRDWDKAK